jgi:flagellin-like hook-associated protein FlgL
MAITSLSTFLGTSLVRDTVQMRDTMRDLERQLATNKRADNYADLGSQRRLSVSFRQTISQVNSWQDSVNQVDLRLGISDLTLTRMADLRSDAKGALSPNSFDLNGSGKTTDQQTVKLLLTEFHALLQTDVGGRFIFGGREVETNPVADLDTILNGNGTQDGVSTYIDERRQADQGANGLGRLTVPARVGTTVSFGGEAPATMPFGAKITGINSDTPAMVSTYTAAAGATPASVDVDFAAQPNVGQKVTVTFQMPNGVTDSITVEAGTLISSDDNMFEIGATPADTAQNFRDLIEDRLRLQANSSLEGASALQASYEFFQTSNGSAPQRVNGPPFATATALMNGTNADTVSWYTGENTAEDPRTGAVTRVDREQSVSYGMRANEDAFAWMMAKMSAFVLEDVSAGTNEDKARHSRMAEMINTDLSDRPGNPLIEAVHMEITSAYSQATRAGERHELTVNQYQNMVDDIENISQEEVAVQILQLQTQMEASYSVTARLSQLSLVNFLN